MPQIAATAIIYPNVELADDVIVEDFCIIGAPFKGQSNEKTIVGNHSVIRSHTVIYAGNTIGSHFQTGNKANIRELNTIGNHVSIGTLSVVEHHVTIEDYVRLHTQVFVPEFCILKQGAWLGPNVVLTNAKYPQSPDAKTTLVGCIIEKNAKIGANATLLPGITVGENALIGSGSVVTKSVDPNSIVAGNPAKFIRKVFY